MTARGGVQPDRFEVVPDSGTSPMLLQLLQPHKDGVVWDMSHEAYLAADGMSRSELARTIEQSPYHTHELKRERTEEEGPRPPGPKPSDEMAAGTLLHTVLLEPGTVYTRYAIGPEVKSKSVKAWRDFAAAHPDRECITPLQHRVAVAQAQALSRTPLDNEPDAPTLSDLLHGARIEASAFWRDDASGLWCKCRPDAAVDVGKGRKRGWCLIDIKTSRSAKPEDFAKSVEPYAYDMQDSFYSEGWFIATGRPVLSFMFAVVESQYPYVTKLFTLPAAWREYGGRRCRTALDIYAACERTGVWPAYGRGVMELEPPRWHPLNRQWE